MLGLADMLLPKQTRAFTSYHLWWAGPAYLLVHLDKKHTRYPPAEGASTYTAWHGNHTIVPKMLLPVGLAQ